MYNLDIDTVRFTEPCKIPDFGHRNQDGYVRVLDKPRSQGGKLKMYHRTVWELLIGPIPVGHEINHLCKNRECCEITHLECIPVPEHRAKDNRNRYKDRVDKIVEFCKANPNLKQSEVAEIFGVTQSGVSLILSRNKKEKQ